MEKHPTNPNETYTAITELLEEERTMTDTAEALKETIVYSITKQIQWWRRFAVIAVLFAIGITIVTFYNRQVLSEIEEQQVDVDQLVQYVNRLEESARESSLELSVPPALETVFRLERVICQNPIYYQACIDEGVINE